LLTRINKIIVFDFNRTLHDPDSDSLVPNVRLVLDELKNKGHTLPLLSRREGGRDAPVDSLGTRDYFSKAYFVDQKSVDNFKVILSEYDARASSGFVVGDYVPDEIAFGNKIGTTTIWARRGKFSDLTPALPHEHPNYTVRNLRDILEIID